MQQPHTVCFQHCGEARFSLACLRLCVPRCGLASFIINVRAHLWTLWCWGKGSCDELQGNAWHWWESVCVGERLEKWEHGITSLHSGFIYCTTMQMFYSFSYKYTPTHKDTQLDTVRVEKCWWLQHEMMYDTVYAVCLCVCAPQPHLSLLLRSFEE